MILCNYCSYILLEGLLAVHGSACQVKPILTNYKTTITWTELILSKM